MHEEKVNSQYIFHGKILSLRVDDVKLVNGKIAKREVIEHKGAVAILAVKDNLIWLVRQYRYPYQELLLEVPAGKLKAEEEPNGAAIRELREEVGLIAHNLVSLGQMYPSPGYANEVIYLYYTDDFEISNNHLDDDEFLEIIKLPIDTILNMIDEGTIKDAKTISIILKYQRKVKKNGK